MEGKLWRIGEVAKATGLTVRTLHHYDEIGLLRPSERTYSGYPQGLLERILDAADSASGEDYMEAIEAMTMFEEYYTSEQLDQLERRRQELGEERQAEYHREWEELIAEAKAEQANGTDPTDPRMRAIAGRWMELIEAFTGGDPGILGGLKTMFEEEGPERASRGVIDPQLMRYVGEAMRPLTEQAD